MERALPPGNQPTQYCLVGHIAAVQVGDQAALLKRVAYGGPQHDDGAASAPEQPAQIELLQSRLPA
jgi:hypothetical protein